MQCADGTGLDERVQRRGESLLPDGTLFPLDTRVGLREQPLSDAASNGRTSRSACSRACCFVRRRAAWALAEPPAIDDDGPLLGRALVHGTQIASFRVLFHSARVPGSSSRKQTAHLVRYRRRSMRVAPLMPSSTPFVGP